MSPFLDTVVAFFGYDPFAYLVVTIVGIVVWVWCTAVTSVALTGRGLWIRRISLVVAAISAVLFAYSASTMR